MLAALLISLFFSYQALVLVAKERALNREVAGLETQVKKIEEQNKLLDQEIARGHTPEVIEKLAKEQLNLQKPGELVTVIVSAASSTDATQAPVPSLWERLKSLFRH